MLLVVDANVLFSALIKDSGTAELITSDKFELITPEFVLAEFEEHEREILKKTHRSESDFQKFMFILRSKIEIIPLPELRKFVKEAEKISPDSDDIHYFAAALKFNCPIWTQDKKLKNQSKIKIYNTLELIRKLS
ncbi:MAG: PIN domain-containing protein [Nanoarchaeota archaeon]|nr:PIN domain-containing protein [Nanoarchaeota archaeon]MBU1501309.1 PIN domain-containing protein [Nanoarchaeota archaeon]MBU2459420.1 PIN domain-containing protein [Nanoarchaeota archaeon]